MKQIERITEFTGYETELLTIDDDGKVVNVEVTERGQDQVHDVVYRYDEFPWNRYIEDEDEASALDEAYAEYFY